MPALTAYVQRMYYCDSIDDGEFCSYCALSWRARTHVRGRTVHPSYWEREIALVCFNVLEVVDG